MKICASPWKDGRNSHQQETNSSMLAGPFWPPWHAEGWFDFINSSSRLRRPLGCLVANFAAARSHLCFDTVLSSSARFLWKDEKSNLLIWSVLANIGGEWEFSPANRWRQLCAMNQPPKHPQHLWLCLWHWPGGKGVRVPLRTYLRLLGLVAASHRLAVNHPSLFPTLVQEGSSYTWSCVIASIFFHRRMTQSPSFENKRFCCVMEEQSWRFLSTLHSLLSLTTKLASIPRL